MSAYCGAEHPDSSATCRKAPGDHEYHAGGSAVWRNESFAGMTYEDLRTHRPSKKTRRTRMSALIGPTPTASVPPLAQRAARDEGIVQALTASSVAQWRAAATAALKDLAASGQEFTADHLVERVGLPHESESNANNALGGIFSVASKAGLIERMPHQVQSQRNHARWIAVWRGTSSH